jgi:hypothetical protein
MEPRYWLNKKAWAGQPGEDDLVRISAEATAAHTAIIAQSGSGKSFFLGRFVEELILHTKAKCLIFDPNADFRRVHEIESEKLWKKPSYDLHTRGGKLPHESNQDEFRGAWSSVSVRIHMGEVEPGEHFKRLSLRWPAISIDFLTEDLGAAMRGQMYHCHSFVKAIERLLARDRDLVTFKANTQKAKLDLLEVAEELFDKERKARDGSVLKQAFGVDVPIQRDPFSFRRVRRERLLDRATRAVKYVSQAGQRLYFGKAREYQAAGILDTTLPSEDATKIARLEVIDLPSLPDRATRFLAVNATLANEWDAARAAWNAALREPTRPDTRVPTFVVVDEAHNLIAADPQTRAGFALREQFRTIVAEGRKYGLFLILVTQRPDKLDPLVLSECENKAIMKLSSRSVLELSQRMLGLEDVGAKVLNKCLEFDIGRVLLLGNWTPEGPLYCYAAARRTVEGGRNLPKEHWAVPDGVAPVVTSKGSGSGKDQPRIRKKRSGSGRAATR